MSILSCKNDIQLVSYNFSENMTIEFFFIFYVSLSDAIMRGIAFYVFIYFCKMYRLYAVKD
jgi:hypothetical protein